MQVNPRENEVNHMAEKVPAALNNAYSDAQMREAIRYIAKYRRATKDMSLKDIPEWMILARRQYNRINAAKQSADRQARVPKSSSPRKINQSLKDDGIIDWMAVRMVVENVRRPRLTRKEKVLAYAYMFEVMGLKQWECLERLNQAQSGRLIKSVQEGEHKDILAAIERGEMDTSGDPLKF